MYCSPERGSRFLLAICSLLTAGSCSRQPPPAHERLAILRFENLTPDAAPDWMGRAFSEVIGKELAVSPSLYVIPTARMHGLGQSMGTRPVSAPGISAETPLAVGLGANRIGYGEYAIVNGRLRARLTVEDLRTGRLARQPIEASAEASGVIAAATEIARQLSRDAQPYGTSNPAALEAYVRAVETSGTDSIERYAEQALAADPNFGPASILLAEVRLKRQDAAGALAVMGAAAARGTALAQTDRIRLEILATTLRGDFAGLERALAALTQATPLDPAAWRSLADTEFRARRFSQAVHAYQRALAIEPEDAAGWNQLGYAAAYAGDAEAALGALRRYRALRPADPNPIDSLGDVNVLLGRLADAERFYLEAYKAAPGFLNGADLRKAAMARLMTGDTAGANAIMKGAGGAEWLWATGRRKEAFAKLAAEVTGMTSREQQGHAFAELAMWSMLSGDRETAMRMGEKAAALTTQANAPAVAVARFTTLPPASPAEWSARARQFFPNAPPNSIREIALAYALLLNREFGAAAQVLKQLEERNPPNPERSAAIQLAWALVETGDFQAAAPLLRLNPVPAVNGTGLFLGLHFPRLYQLRAIVAEKQGKADEARENRRIYAALGGT